MASNVDFFKNFREAFTSAVNDATKKAFAETDKSIKESASKKVAVSDEAKKKDAVERETKKQFGKLADSLRAGNMDDFLITFRNIAGPGTEFYNKYTNVANESAQMGDTASQVVNHWVNEGGIADALTNGKINLNVGNMSVADATKSQKQQTAEQQEPGAQDEPGTVGMENGSDVTEYIYAPGDTFGRVLMKIGLSDGRNLWGPNGDVAYYTKQLNDQGIYGNIPIGTKIRLRKRQ